MLFEKELVYLNPFTPEIPAMMTACNIIDRIIAIISGTDFLLHICIEALYILVQPVCQKIY
ncbi:MAG: hypothetical protein Q7J70_01745 [Thermodesulfovibrionales bacterium]|nr:hypothetical protein [Thermodesulfovibrionales bacterium]